jgi:hypothetical membrane protein
MSRDRNLSRTHGKKDMIMTRSAITQTGTAKSEGACSPATRRTRSLLGYGMIAGPFYLVISVTEGLVRPGFDFTRHDWSLLSNGSYGWVHITNFMVTGLMTIACAVGVRRSLRPGPGTRWAPRLIGAYGAGLIGGAIFRADPALGFPPGTPKDAHTVSWHGLLHLAAGGIGFLCLITACMVIARRFGTEGRRGWALYSRATGALFFVGFACIASAANAPWATLAFTAAIVIAWTWITSLSLHLYRRATIAAPASPTGDV